MDLYKTKIDWTSPNALDQIAQKIKCPLDSIVAANERVGLYGNTEYTELIFTSSKEISNVIDEIVNAVRSNNINLSYKSCPDIFQIYDTNERVQSMCTKKVKPETISVSDQSWLIDFEKEIYNSINKSDLNLYELSYKMAVSERQLHRKIGALVFLTPNKYVRILRLYKAKQMIDNFIYNTISQIAYAVGYNDTHYFSKIFYNQYNIMPQELLLSFE